jgi:hypothetical protein
VSYFVILAVDRAREGGVVSCGGGGGLSQKLFHPVLISLAPHGPSAATPKFNRAGTDC